MASEQVGPCGNSQLHMCRTRKCSEIVADSKSQWQMCKQDHAVTRKSCLMPGRPANSGPVEPYMQHNICELTRKCSDCSQAAKVICKCASTAVR